MQAFLKILNGQKLISPHFANEHSDTVLYVTQFTVIIRSDFDLIGDQSSVGVATRTVSDIRTIGQTTHVDTVFGLRISTYKEA